MRILILIAKRNIKRGTKTRSTYLLHVDMANQHAIDKGHEVFTVNAYKENENDPYCGNDNSKIFSDPNPFIAIAQALNVDAIVCLSTERTLERDALIKKELESKGITVITNSLEFIKTLSYKENAKRFFFQNGIPTPKGGIFKNRYDLESLVNQLGFPLITKRNGFTGGRGNKVLKNHADLNAFINGQDCFGEEIIVEKFIYGIELSMEIVGHNGSYLCMPLIYKGCTKEHPINRLCYVSYSNEKIKKSIKKLALKIAKKLNLCGSAELEVIWEPYSNSIYVLEVNPRISGTTLLGEAYTDISIPKNLIDMADNTWNNDLDFVTTNKLSIELDLTPDLPKSKLGEVYALPTFFECSRHNLKGQCVKFILSGNTNNVMADINTIKLMEVSSILKGSINSPHLYLDLEKKTILF
ncbi:ATP-grasp domain-containing protein [Bacillus toyonensis]|uniref:ATP-grasp domain-containing protein n=1 Tax=Bacillus toyonensis TaxID=155322 RepID=UPI003D212F09